MKFSTDLKCLFSAEVTADGESASIEIPKRELSLGELEPGAVVRVAVVEQYGGSNNPQGRVSTQGGDGGRSDSEAATEVGHPTPPVSEGEQRVVEIETLGEQGDGIARVERGFVVIVPGTQEGDRVAVEIENVQESVAFAKVVNGQ
ncbi:TRAM domain-containing protein [Halobaculum lipolyticum]|uniref:TRAM domain-containing protein n=1 Tax=Halobaculum lipolyticum TaxID=3032001 RepID=A0ABD5WFP5_9EURY